MPVVRHRSYQRGPVDKPGSDQACSCRPGQDLQYRNVGHRARRGALGQISGRSPPSGGQSSHRPFVYTRVPWFHSLTPVKIIVKSCFPGYAADEFRGLEERLGSDRYPKELPPTTHLNWER